MVVSILVAGVQTFNFKMGDVKMDETQAKLSGLFDEDGLKSSIPLTIFSDGNLYLNLNIMKGFEKIRKEGKKVLEVVFRVNGNVNADFYWIAEDEKEQLEHSGALSVDFIEFGNFMSR